MQGIHIFWQILAISAITFNKILIEIFITGYQGLSVLIQSFEKYK